MTPPVPARRLVPALAAVAGVVVAHVVDYLLLFPASGHRSGHLAATGHGYWSVAVAAAVAAAAVTAMLVAARGALQPQLSAGGAVVQVRWRDLLAWQTAAFLGMEVGERAAAGVAFDALLRAPELWFGLALQVPVAWLVARLLRTLERVAAKLATHVRPAWARASHEARRPAASLAGPLAGLASPARPRAPPVPRSI